MLTHSIYIYATHGIPLDCDVYTSDDQIDAVTAPVLLFFHAGGLVGGSRACVPPWLIQACYQRRWPLISPSYRLLPQTGAEGLLEDATAAYEFAQTYGASVTGRRRSVIVAGASAGFFMASLITHHVTLKPVALLGISGIPTFQHPFFRSSILLPPVPITDGEVEGFVSGPAVVGSAPAYSPSPFYAIEYLLPFAERKSAYVTRPAKAPTSTVAPRVLSRECLYDYYLHRNAFVDLVGDLDPGFAWAKDVGDELHAEKLECWPPTIFIQGDQDSDVSADVTMSTVDSLGSEKAKLFRAEGQGHLFEATLYLEDESPAMDVVREAIQALDLCVRSSLMKLMKRIRLARV